MTTNEKNAAAVAAVTETSTRLDAVDARINALLDINEKTTATLGGIEGRVAALEAAAAAPPKSEKLTPAQIAGRVAGGILVLATAALGGGAVAVALTSAREKTKGPQGSLPLGGSTDASSPPTHHQMLMN